MKLPIIKKDGNTYLALPNEFSTHSELELFKLKDGFYLVSFPLDKAVETIVPKESSSTLTKPSYQSLEKETEQKTAKISASEVSVLKKLFAIEFKNRTKDYVDKSLSNDERKILLDLEKKNFINLFKGVKYKNGVYNINDKIYPLLLRNLEPNTPQTNRQTTQSSHNNKVVPQTLSNVSAIKQETSPKTPLVSLMKPFEALQKNRFVVISNEKDARDLSDQIKTDMKSGLVVGIRGFDGKFYVIKKEYYSQILSTIAPKLSGTFSAEDLSSQSSFSSDAIRCVLQLLADSGEVIEKKKGYFELA